MCNMRLSKQRRDFESSNVGSSTENSILCLVDMSNMGLQDKGRKYGSTYTTEEEYGSIYTTEEYGSIYATEVESMGLPSRQK